MTRRLAALALFGLVSCSGAEQPAPKPKPKPVLHTDQDLIANPITDPVAKRAHLLNSMNQQKQQARQRENLLDQVIDSNRDQ